MKIQPLQNNNPNTSFGAKISTPSVFEVTSMKIFHNDGVEGFKEVTKALLDKPIKATGAKGYKYYANIFGKQIMEKYPEIAKATEDIKNIVAQNPLISKLELEHRINPIIKKFGPTIDIIL